MLAGKISVPSFAEIISVKFGTDQVLQMKPLVLISRFIDPQNLWGFTSKIRRNKISLLEKFAERLDTFLQLLDNFCMCNKNDSDSQIPIGYTAIGEISEDYTLYVKNQMYQEYQLRNGNKWLKGNAKPKRSIHPSATVNQADMIQQNDGQEIE